MFNFRNKAWALLLAALIIPAGCHNSVQQGSGSNIGGNTAPPAAGTSASQTPPSSAPSTGQDSGSAAKPTADKPSNNDESKRQTSSGSAKGQPTAIRLADAESGWAAGAGWISRTDDGGKHWQDQYLGSSTMTQIFALNSKQAWAETDTLNLLGTSDGGSHWTVVGKAPNNGFLHFVSANEAFAANATTTNGGKTWNTLPVPKNMVGDAYFHDKNNGWAVIQINGMAIIERTENGGKTWQNVMGLKLASPLNGTLIRSAGADDAWVEWIGDSGMSQTSYSLFHTSDGGKSWVTVLANSSAGGGPAPGFPTEYNGGPKNQGSKPGPLYVVDRKTAYMGGECPACDKPNTVGKTTDGGKTWVSGTDAFPGYAGELLGMADDEHGWLICTDNAEASAMYTTSDGGKHWSKVYEFPKSKKAT